MLILTAKSQFQESSKVSFYLTPRRTPILGPLPPPFILPLLNTRTWTLHLPGQGQNQNKMKNQTPNLPEIPTCKIQLNVARSENACLTTQSLSWSWINQAIPKPNVKGAVDCLISTLAKRPRLDWTPSANRTGGTAWWTADCIIKGSPPLLYPPLLSQHSLGFASTVDSALSAYTHRRIWLNGHRFIIQVEVKQLPES